MWMQFKLKTMLEAGSYWFNVLVWQKYNTASYKLLVEENLQTATPRFSGTASED